MKKQMLFVLLFSCLAFGQGVQNIKGTSGSGAPSSTLVPGDVGSQYVDLKTGNLYVCTAITRTANALTCSWSQVGGGGGTATAIGAAGNPVASTAATQFGQRYINRGTSPNNFALASGFGYELADWGIVADDSTDNCTAVAAWTAAVNAYSGSGVPTATITMGVGDLAVLFKTCHAEFDIPVTLAINATLDCGSTNSSANCIQLGPSNLSQHVNTQVQPYTVTGNGTITGGGSLTHGVIEAESWLSEVMIHDINFHNAGGASNWVILEGDRISGSEIYNIMSWNDDTTDGRNFFKNVPSVTEGTVHMSNVHAIYTKWADQTHCGGIGYYVGGGLSRFDDVEAFAYGAQILLSDAAGSSDMAFNHLVLDTWNCSRLGVQSAIQVGDPGGTGPVGPITVIGGSFSSHAGDQALFTRAGDNTSTTVTDGSTFAFNHSSGAIGIANWSCSVSSNCNIFGNTSFTVPNSWPLLNTSDGTHAFKALWDGSAYRIGGGAYNMVFGDVTWTAGSPLMQFKASDHTVTFSNMTIGHMAWQADNTIDFGTSSADRPRTGYFATSVVAPVGTFATSVNTATVSATTSVTTPLVTASSEVVTSVTAGGIAPAGSAYATSSSYGIMPGTGSRNDITASVGYFFTVAKPIVITQLGRKWMAGNSQNHGANLWISTNTSTPLATGTILNASSSDGDGFKWIAVTPVVLTPGHTYAIATDEAASGDTWITAWAPTLASVFTSSATYGSTYGMGSGVYPGSGTPGANTSEYGTAAMQWAPPFAVSVTDLSGNVLYGVNTNALVTTTNCSAAGSAANPSLVACGTSPTGAFSCSATASTGTCTVATTAVTTNSDIHITPTASAGTRLSVTCNTTADVPAGPRVASISNGVSFTINLGTLVSNPGCYFYSIVN